MSDNYSEFFYYGVEDFVLGRYDYKAEPNDITLEQNITAKLTSSSIESTANEIKKLREAINLLKQTAENQKDLFSKELRHCNEEIRFLKRKFEERNKIRSRKSRQEQQLDTRKDEKNGEPHLQNRSRESSILSEMTMPSVNDLREEEDLILEEDDNVCA